MRNKYLLKLGFSNTKYNLIQSSRQLNSQKRKDDKGFTPITL